MTDRVRLLARRRGGTSAEKPPSACQGIQCPGESELGCCCLGSLVLPSGFQFGHPAVLVLLNDLHPQAQVTCSQRASWHYSRDGDGPFGSAVAQHLQKPHSVTRGDAKRSRSTAESVPAATRRIHRPSRRGRGQLISRVAQLPPLLAGVFSLVDRDPLRDDVAHPSRNPSEVDSERSGDAASSSRVVRDLEYSYMFLLLE